MTSRIKKRSPSQSVERRPTVQPAPAGLAFGFTAEGDTNATLVKDTALKAFQDRPEDTPAWRWEIFAADPLVCPDCHGPMRIVAFIEEPRVVRAILEHLSLWDAQRPRPVAAVGPADFEYVPCED